MLAAMIGGTVLSDRLPLLTSGAAIYTARLYPTAGTIPALFSDLSGILIGHGTGTALTATAYVNGGAPVSRFWESYTLESLYMFGLLGWVIYGALFMGIALTGMRAYRAVARASSGWLAGALLLYGIFTMLDALIGDPLSYPPVNTYFWLFMGALAGVGATAAGVRSARPSHASLVKEHSHG